MKEDELLSVELLMVWGQWRPVTLWTSDGHTEFDVW